MSDPSEKIYEALTCDLAPMSFEAQHLLRIEALEALAVLRGERDMFQTTAQDQHDARFRQQKRAEAAEASVVSLKEALRVEKRLRVEMSCLLTETQKDECYARAALASSEPVDDQEKARREAAWGDVYEADALASSEGQDPSERKIAEVEPHPPSPLPKEREGGWGHPKR